MTGQHSPSDHEGRIEEGRLELGDMTIGYLACGEGPLALCLHGFPDSAHSWRPLMAALAGAGFRAVAPFLRGYAPTDIPGDGWYQTAALARDANAVHEALGADGDAVVIGHDWGAPTAYGAANVAPDRWRAVVGMAVPPGPALAMSFLDDLEQLKRSWYMFFFQSPLAELVVGADDLAFIDMIWRDWSPGFDGTEGAERAKACMREDGRLAAALGYYRAALGDGPKDPALDEAQALTQVVPSQPMLYLHGVNDGCIGIDVARRAEEMHAANGGDNVRWVHVDGAGHFPQLERHDTVADTVVDWLSRV
jgi:pimeloyl-ACP methyl ester carboxylesterase